MPSRGYDQVRRYLWQREIENNIKPEHAALLRVFGWWPFRVAVDVYVYVVRGVPLLLLLFFMYYGLPYSGIHLAPVPGGILVMSVYFGAFMSEVFRAAIEALPRAQWDAARSLGMRLPLILAIVVLPQAVRLSAPAFINTCILLIKSTSLVSIIVYGLHGNVAWLPALWIGVSGEPAARAIIRGREEGGPFTSIWEFCERVDPQASNKRALESLVKCGALDSTGATRRGMLEALEAALSHGARAQTDRLLGQSSLFGEEEKLENVPISGEEFEKSELLRLEKEVLGLYVSEHPLHSIRDQLRRKTDCALADVERVFREEYGRAVAVLTRVFGDIDTAEDAVQDAFAEAARRWPAAGLPPSPAGWIITTARNRAIDRLRRERDLGRKHVHSLRDPGRCAAPPDAGGGQPFQGVAVADHGHELSVLRHDPVPRRVQGHARSDDRSLLSEGRREHTVETLPLHGDRALVVRARHQHPPQRLEQHRGGHPRLRASDQASVRFEC